MDFDLSQIMDAVDIAFFVIDNDHCIIDCNKAYEDLTGLPKQDMLGTNKQWIPFYGSQRNTLADFIVDQASQDDITQYYGDECKGRYRRDHSYNAEIFFPQLGVNGKWIYCTASPLRDQLGNIIGAVETLQDLTVFKQVEEALILSEQKSKTILDQIEDGYYEVDLKGQVTFLNDAFCRILGYSRDELLGLSYKVFADKSYVEKVYQMFNRVYMNKEPLKELYWEIVRKDGSKRHVQFSVSLMLSSTQEPTGFRGIVRDVTEARNAQKELVGYRDHLEELVHERTFELERLNKQLNREIEERKKAEQELLRGKYFSEDIIKSLPCLFYMIKEDGKFVKWNKNLEMATGYSFEELADNMHAQDYFEGEERDLIIARMNEVFAKGRSSAQAHIVAKDGTRTPYFITGVRTEINEVTYQVGVCIDTADLERAEKALQESEEKLSAILSAVTDYMIIIDRDFNIVWANDLSKRVLGTDLINLKCYSVFHGRLKPCSPCIGKKCFTIGGIEEREGQFADSEGNRIDFWSTTSVVTRWEDGRPKQVLELFRDTTEKKALEAESVRVGQLASLGELAAGVAHEINNPINSIINYSQILLDQLDDHTDDFMILNRIRKEGERVTTIVENLLSFARDSKDKLAPTSIEHVIDAALGLMGKQLQNDGITVKLNFMADLPHISANHQQLQQVALNIISNARYALNQKFSGPHQDKILEIKAEKGRIDSREFIRILFQDRGTGIPKEILNKICDPFFSTKPKDEGTGLGLNISHGIIKKHGGKLWFDSVLGDYTKVVVDLPMKIDPEKVR